MPNAPDWIVPQIAHRLVQGAPRRVGCDAIQGGSLPMEGGTADDRMGMPSPGGPMVTQAQNLIDPASPWHRTGSPTDAGRQPITPACG